jgi:hypothetical protein
MILQMTRRLAALTAVSMLLAGSLIPHLAGGDALLTTARSVTVLEERTGGFTYHLTRGSLAGTDAYAVAVFPERSLIMDSIPCERDIARFIQSNADLLNDPQFALGGWFDQAAGKTYLDISVVVASRDIALALGSDYNQKAILHLRTLNEIPTGGSGAALDPAKLPHAADRVKATQERLRRRNLDRALHDIQAAASFISKRLRRGVVQTWLGDSAGPLWTQPAL